MLEWMNDMSDSTLRKVIECVMILIMIACIAVMAQYARTHHFPGLDGPRTQCELCRNGAHR
jgi:hypothetical protein